MWTRARPKHPEVSFVQSENPWTAHDLNQTSYLTPIGSSKCAPYHMLFYSPTPNMGGKVGFGPGGCPTSRRPYTSIPWRWSSFEYLHLRIPWCKFNQKPHVPTTNDCLSPDLVLDVKKHPCVIGIPWCTMARGCRNPPKKNL